MEDLSDRQFERLRVICRDGTYNTDKGFSEPTYRCLCDCGNYITVRASQLRSGNTKSCGCYAKDKFNDMITKHGYCDKERLYRIWDLMRNRCNNTNNPRYKLYGGRGISVCEEWDNYEIFRMWSIENNYDETLSIDRIDVNGNYEQSNCRWVTQKEQCNNKRNNHYITFQNETHTMMEWSEILHINYSTLRSRLNIMHWSVERALTI